MVDQVIKRINTLDIEGVLGSATGPIYRNSPNWFSPIPSNGEADRIERGLMEVGLPS